MTSRIMRRRRGAGMTEYIIIVGLVGAAMVAVVNRFRQQIDVTVVGNNGNGGIAGSGGAFDKNITGQMDKLNKNKGTNPSRP